MRNPDPQFAGRNWQDVKVQELVNPDDLRFVDIDSAVEAATNVRCPVGLEYNADERLLDPH